MSAEERKAKVAKVMEKAMMADPNHRNWYAGKDVRKALDALDAEDFVVLKKPKGMKVAHGDRLEAMKSEVHFTDSEIAFLVSRCEDMRLRWLAHLSWAESHYAIIQRDRAAEAIANIDALVTKVKAQSPQRQVT